MPLPDSRPDQAASPSTLPHGVEATRGSVLRHPVGKPPACGVYYSLPPARAEGRRTGPGNAAPSPGHDPEPHETNQTGHSL